MIIMGIEEGRSVNTGVRIPTEEEIGKAGLEQEYVFRREGSNYEGRLRPIIIGETFVRLFSEEVSVGWAATAGCSYQILSGPAKGIVVRIPNRGDLDVVRQFITRVNQREAEIAVTEEIE